MAAAVAKTERLLSLDVMRGATIMGMILGNNPGSWGRLYPPLAHAAWHGWTPTDLIFPFFIFMVGVSMAFSFRKFESPSLAVLGKILRRTAILILLGLLLNSSGQWLGMLFGERATISFSTIRLPGVLQRIGLAYLGAALLVLCCRPIVWRAVGLVLLVGYAALLLSVPRGQSVEGRLSPSGNIVRVVDLAVLGADHMYTQARSEPTDPEGLLSTLPAIVTALLGFEVGRFLQHDFAWTRKMLLLLAAGVLLAIVGQVWHYVEPSLGGMPVNKKLWTSSFVLLTAGLATLSLTCCLWLFDWQGRESRSLQRMATAFQMVGVNAIFVFVASGIAARLLTMIPMGSSNLKDVYYQTVFVGPLGDTRLASLGYAVSVVAFWWLVLWIMWRKGWSIRV